MNAMLDILCSFVIGALLMLNLQRMNGDLVTRTYKGGNEYVAQSNATFLSEMLNEDLHKVGYGVTGKKITLADSTHLTFYGDVNRNGTVDSVKYVLGGGLPRTTNPRDRMFNRLFNAQSADSASLGVTDFKFTYYDSSGAVTAVSSNIKGIQADVTLESPAPYDTSYAKSFVRVVVWPKNL